MVSLLYTAYNRIQNVLYYSCAKANKILYKEQNNQTQKITLEKINHIEDKIFHQFLEVSHRLDRITHQFDLLQKKLEQIDSAQIYLREEMENISRYKDIESITRCSNYVKKIKKNVLFISIALQQKFTLHESIPSSSCDICMTLLNTFKENLMQIQHYLELATPYLHSFRSYEIRSQLLNMFATNIISEGIANLSIIEEGDQKKSCVNVQNTLDKFTKIFFKIKEEITEIQLQLDLSIREEQERRPSLQKLNIYQI